MSRARNMRRAKAKSFQPHYTVLAVLLGDFYEMLSQTPQPSDGEVRAAFTAANSKWSDYCHSHKLMNMSQLFIDNVREAWARHQKIQ